MTPRPRPWHRSRLFWLGIPGLLFLLWLWYLHPHLWEGRYATPYIERGISTEPGALNFTIRTIEPSHHTQYVFILAGDFAFQQNSHYLEPGNRTYLIRPIALQIDQPDPLTPGMRLTELTLPFWLIVPLYLTAWFTTLHLWQRRKTRRLLENTTTPA